MSISSATFQKMLEEHILWKPKRARYWQNYKDRWWRLCGTYSYKGKRDIVLAAYNKRRKKYGQRNLARILGGPSIFDKIARDSSVWEGKFLPIPFGGTFDKHP